MSRKMKDSGIEWIGEIPEEWEVRKIKNSFIIISGNGFPIVMQGQEQGDYPVCKASDISANNGKIIFGADNYITQKQSIAFNIIPKGSVVFPKIGEAMKKNNRALLGVDACLDNNCQGLVPLCMNKQYSLYMLSCIDMFWYDNAGTVPCINNLRFSNSYIPFPLLSEQQKIASFLDAKCSKIDSLTADIQKQIEILEQYRKSVITETVTKGLDPNVKMKDSGIEWIGGIPEEWEVISCKFCFTIYNGSDPTTKYGDTPVYGSGSKSFKTCEEYKDGPTVLLGRKGTVNIPQWIEGKYWNVDTAFDVKPKGNYNLRLFFYVAICFDYEKYSTQTALPSMTQADYNAFKLPYMSREEQQHIASYLDSKCSKLDKLISLKNRQLETLMQYKKALIYEYVTGKKEVI